MGEGESWTWQPSAIRMQLPHICCHLRGEGFWGNLGLVTPLYFVTNPSLRARVALCVPIIPINPLNSSSCIHTHTHTYTQSYTYLYSDGCTLPFSYPHQSFVYQSIDSLNHSLIYSFVHSFIYSFLCRSASKRFIPKDDSILAQNALESNLQSLFIPLTFQFPSNFDFS